MSNGRNRRVWGKRYERGMSTEVTDLQVLAERVEAEMMYQYMSQASDEAKRGFGIETTRIEGGVVVSARLDPYEYWSRALGFTEPISRDLVDSVIEFYREQSTPTALLQFAPWVQLPPDWDDIRAAHGLQAEGTLLKLGARVSELTVRPVTDLRLSHVGTLHAQAWADVAAEVFGMDHPALTAVFEQSVQHPASTAFAAWPKEQEVPEEVLSFRQNMTFMVQNDKYNPWGRAWWGGVPPGWHDAVHTTRSGLCLTKEGFVAYLFGHDIGPEPLG